MPEGDSPGEILEKTGVLLGGDTTDDVDLAVGLVDLDGVAPQGGVGGDLESVLVLPGEEDIIFMRGSDEGTTPCA